MDAGTLKLFAAIALFSLPVLIGAPRLTGQRLAGRVLTRAEAQALCAVAGLVLGVGYLLAAG